MEIADSIGAFVQIVVAIVLVVGFFLLAFFVYNKEALEAAAVQRSIKHHTYIFRGIKDLKLNNNETYDTSDRQHPTFRNMPASINQSGGAEFTYNFWVYKGDKMGNGISKTLSFKPSEGIENNDLILFVRGSKRKQRFKSECGNTPATANNVMVKCPLVKFQGEDWDNLVVELNTTERPEGVREQARNACGDTKARSWKRANAHKIALAGFADNNFINKWFMITVVLTDTEPSDLLPVRNKVRVRIYINSVLELDRYVDNTLGETTSENPSIILQNRGPMHVGPQVVAMGQTSRNAVPSSAGSDVEVYLANLSFMNYVAQPDEVKALYKEYIDKVIAPAVNSSTVTIDKYKESVDKEKSITAGDPMLAAY